MDGDREFNRLMKKAKTLDEMFAALRKTKFSEPRGAFCTKAPLPPLRKKTP